MKKIFKVFFFFADAWLREILNALKGQILVLHSSN